MVQRRQNARLTLETRHAIFVRGKVLGKHFDRDVPAEFGVARAVDFAHPAFSEKLEDLIMGELVTGLERHDPVMLRRWWIVGKRRDRGREGRRPSQVIVGYLLQT